VRKNLNRQELAEKLSENNIMTDRSGDILEKIDSDVSEEFLHMCIEYKREDINEQLIEAIAPVTAVTLTTKCPFYLGNYKEKAQFVNTYGIKEKDIILHLLRRNMSKSITEEDLSKIIIGEDLRVTPGAIRDVLSFFDEEKRKESEGKRQALMLVETYYELVDKNKSLLLSSSNNVTVVGNAYRIYNIKVSDDEEFSEAYFNRFRETMFINAIAALGRVEKKNIVVGTLVIKSNGLLPILMWKIPNNILDLLGETPESIIKKYISKNLYYLVNGDYFNFPEFKNMNFCTYCGYSKTARCKSKK